MASFPKLLVATECPPNSAGGGAAVIRQMLRDWPAERLFWWSCLPDRNKHFGREVAAHCVARIPPKFYPQRRWCRQKSWVLKKIWTPWATRHFRKTLDTLKPDVVWVIPHAWAIPPLAHVLSNARIGFHVTMQDFMDSNGYLARYGTDRCRLWTKQVEQLYRSATTRDATSLPMMTDLHAHTGAAAAQMLHAGLEEEDFEHLAKTLDKRTNGIRIAYAGTVIAEREFTLFVQALTQIRRRLAAPVCLDFFGDHSYHAREWFDATCMREHGNLPAAELLLALRDCTWGFSPMELTDDNPRYNRFSFPTKFISYLAAGLPVITLGHPESSVVKMAQAYRVGLCVTSNDPDVLARELLVALSDPNARLKYGPEILRCAQTEFDARRMRKTLYDCFRQCADRTGRVRLRPRRDTA